MRAAIAESKRKITVNVPRVRTAHAWLVSNNVGFEDDILGDIDVDANQVLQNVLTVTGNGEEGRMIPKTDLSMFPKCLINRLGEWTPVHIFMTRPSQR